MNTRAFVFKFIETHDITAELMASESWDLNSNKLIFDEGIYNPKNKEWLREVKAPLLPKPSLQEAYKEFQKIVLISQDKESAMVTYIN